MTALVTRRTPRGRDRRQSCHAPRVPSLRGVRSAPPLPRASRRPSAFAGDSGSGGRFVRFLPAALDRTARRGGAWRALGLSSPNAPTRSRGPAAPVVRRIAPRPLVPGTPDATEESYRPLLRDRRRRTWPRFAWRLAPALRRKRRRRQDDYGGGLGGASGSRGSGAHGSAAVHRSCALARRRVLGARSAIAPPIPGAPRNLFVRELDAPARLAARRRRSGGRARGDRSAVGAFAARRSS